MAVNIKLKDKNGQDAYPFTTIENVSGLGSKLISLDQIYPVGSIVFSDVSSFRPAAVYGGEWVEIQGRFLIGAGSNGDGATYTFGNTGGSKDAIVVSHAHDNVYIKVRTNKAGIGNDYGTSGNHVVTNTGASGYGRVDMAYTSTAGSSGTDMNMPPYKVVKIWKRTA